MYGQPLLARAPYHDIYFLCAEFYLERGIHATTFRDGILQWQGAFYIEVDIAAPCVVVGPGAKKQYPAIRAKKLGGRLLDGGDLFGG